MSYLHDADDTDETLQLRQAIIDIFATMEHDKFGRWMIPTMQGYAMPDLGEALDRALKLAIRAVDGQR